MMINATATNNYTLQYPYKTAAGEILETLPVRALTVGDLRKVKRQFKDASDWDEGLIACMCGLVVEDLDGMDLRDYQTLSARFRETAGLAD